MAQSIHGFDVTTLDLDYWNQKLNFWTIEDDGQGETPVTDISAYTQLLNANMRARAGVGVDFCTKIVTALQAR